MSTRPLNPVTATARPEQVRRSWPTLGRLRTAAASRRISRAHERRWAGADTTAELEELTARFCLGELVCRPGHDGARDPGIAVIADTVAHANRCGFLTTASQPGLGAHDVDPTHPLHPATWEQRAAVQGLCDTDTAHRLLAVVLGTRLQIQASTASLWTTDERTAVPVTWINSAPATSFGATLSVRDLRFSLRGIRPHLLDQLAARHQVLIYDPEWGEEDLLWRRLEHL